MPVEDAPESRDGLRRQLDLDCDRSPVGAIPTRSGRSRDSWRPLWSVQKISSTRIEPPERAHEYLAALPESERAFSAVALFCGLRRGELRGLQWTNVDFEAGVIRVERSWDPVKGPVDVKTGGPLRPDGVRRQKRTDGPQGADRT